MAKSTVDWLPIQRDWELDRFKSDRALAAHHTANGNKVSHVSIGHAARGWPDKDGKATRTVWQKRLTEQAELRATEMMTLRDAEGETTEELLASAAKKIVDRRVALQERCEEQLVELRLLGKLLRRRLQTMLDAEHVHPDMEEKVVRTRESYIRQEKAVQHLYREAYGVKLGIEEKRDLTDDESTIDELLFEFERRRSAVVSGTTTGSTSGHSVAPGGG